MGLHRALEAWIAPARSTQDLEEGAETLPRLFPEFKAYSEAGGGQSFRRSGSNAGWGSKYFHIAVSATSIRMSV